MASFQITPTSVEEIFKDFSSRRASLLRALTTDVEHFYSLCDPGKDNLCLYGHPHGWWEVALPAVEVPADLPEPALGINYARDGMARSDWLMLVALHSDSWLTSVAFYYGARLNRDERKRLFTMMNELPTVLEVVTGKKPMNDQPSIPSGSQSMNNTEFFLQRSNAEPKVIPRQQDESHGEDNEHSESFCGTCGGIYNTDEFWIGCDICERWYHGNCVKITPSKAERIKKYKCPSCCGNKSKQ